MMKLKNRNYLFKVTRCKISFPSPPQQASMIRRNNYELLRRKYHRERGSHAPGIRKTRKDKLRGRIFIEALGRAKKSGKTEN